MLTGIMSATGKIRIILALLCICDLAVNICGYEFNFEPKDEDLEGLPMILWWDGLGNRKDYIISCGDLKCVVSHNQSALHKEPVMVYAYYASNFMTSGLPLPRKDGDLWALIHEESPKNMDWLFTFESALELFNYTATFQRESHFPFPTHWLTSEKALANMEYFVSTKEKNRLQKEEELAPIMFVHSDCSTPSKREGYLEQLMKYVDVDSYGACLHNKDFPESFGDEMGYGSYRSPEFLKFIARYKFAIAIENAICDDYMTEKLWRPLEVGSVPIVMGSPKVKDFLPSNKSAVLINDFDSVQDLAEHIKYLDSHDEEYEKYLQFKNKGISNPTLTSELERMSPGPNEEQNFMTAVFGYECFLCDKLHTARDASRAGEPIPKSQASLSHFDCPLPTQKFDEDGKLVHDSLTDREVDFYKRNAEAFRNLYDSGEHVTATDLYEHTWELVKKAKLARKDEL